MKLLPFLNTFLWVLLSGALSAKEFTRTGSDTSKPPLRFGASFGLGWYQNQPYFFGDSRALLVFAHQAFVEKELSSRFSAQCGFRYASINEDNSFNRESSDSGYSPLRTYSLETSLRWVVAKDEDTESQLYVSLGSGLQWLSPVVALKSDPSPGPVITFSPSLVTFGSAGVEFRLSDHADMRIELRILGSHVMSKTEDLLKKTTTYRQEKLSGGQVGFQFIFRP